MIPEPFAIFPPQASSGVAMIGYQLAQLKLQELFEAHGLLPARH